MGRVLWTVLGTVDSTGYCGRYWALYAALVCSAAVNTISSTGCSAAALDTGCRVDTTGLLRCQSAEPV